MWVCSNCVTDDDVLGLMTSRWRIAMDRSKAVAGQVMIDAHYVGPATQRKERVEHGFRHAGLHEIPIPGMLPINTAREQIER